MASYTPDELLRIVADERDRAVGLDNSDQLRESRERALRFMKGDMTREVPSLPNRSAAVSTDTADAVHTLMPDLLEIFIGGDDPLTFRAVSQEDEDAAEQETDYIRHVIFEQNRGFQTLHAMFYDALVQKVGVVKFWWEEGKAQPEEELSGQTAEDLTALLEAGDSELVEYEPEAEGEIPTFKATVRRKTSGTVKIEAVAPEDFAVSADTIHLPEATYCVHRSRPRAQDLIAAGADPDIIDRLPGVALESDEIDQARDTAGENDLSDDGGATRELRRVEVLEHYIRLFDGERYCVHRVQTNGDSTVLIDSEEVNRIPFAAITPYLVAHRFYGMSVADLLAEIQKINTVLTRAALDSSYFALNQRMEVADAESNEFTIPDLLRNEPGVPIRSRSGNAVRPIQAGQIGFDVFGALEYFQTKAEQRTGIVRNAQGLNPDTLHETAKGAQALMAAAQKRIRMIARVFAETGIKDLYLGVHATIREHAEEHRAGVFRLRSGWQSVNPTSWRNREDMVVDVGIGSGGRDTELAMLGMQAQILERVVQLQGGASGPMLNMQGVYAFTKDYLSKAGNKKADVILTDPANVPPQPPQPDPAVMELEVKSKLQAAEMQGKQRLEQARIQADAQSAQAKAQTEIEIARLKAEAELTLQREKMQLEDAFRREQGAAEIQLKRDEMELEARIKSLSTVYNGAQQSTTVDGPQMGGEPG